MKHHVLSRAVAVALLAAAGSAAAITNVENNSSIPFSFSNPGARSLGMGGAFLGAADCGYDGCRLRASGPVGGLGRKAMALSGRTLRSDERRFGDMAQLHYTAAPLPTRFADNPGCRYRSSMSRESTHSHPLPSSCRPTHPLQPRGAEGVGW